MSRVAHKYHVKWFSPIPYALTATSDGDSWQRYPYGVTGVPTPGHPGSFGYVRKNHVHEGIDLYCQDGTPVRTVEAGKIVARFPFTGPLAGSPWWLDTECIMVEGASGVVLYGEITPLWYLKVGQTVSAHEHIGNVTRVLAKDKGRPMSMLHLELHARGATFGPAWDIDQPAPVTLRDPTPYLLPLCFPSHTWDHL